MIPFDSILGDTTTLPKEKKKNRVENKDFSFFRSPIVTTLATKESSGKKKRYVLTNNYRP